MNTVINTVVALVVAATKVRAAVAAVGHIWWCWRPWLQVGRGVGVVPEKR